ncbi:putative lipid II flippase FtsW [Virgibacillus halodenitrificans]|uniref:putative lipid II flippase FtsW n=1 Tax=Virgibacillus halodenitrificans TaxID=1482 RepID=UPI0013708897|nr:putative lipid II flippase FtsW [Virgibacillus halodenitrificans]MYL46524.1 putative lipid II flippase FtsW [Virgibacillus halodenitrificans]
MIQKLKDYDFTLIITPILLAAFGMVMIYSASMVTSIVEGHESTHYLMKQLQWFVIGLAGFIFCSIFPYKYYQKLMKIIILFVILLLVGVLLFGTTINNAKSWFSFGPISLQPAELAKLALIMYLASVYSKKQSYINEFTKGVLPPLVLTGIILSLIVLQPDIGTASIIFLIACSVIFSAGIRFKHLFILIGIGLVILAIAIPNMVTDVRISRFTGAYQPFQAPEDGGYHLIQSYLAIGGGGITGEGLGQSVQKLGYLMEAHTDFIMAIIAEELGFVGVMIVIGMIATIVLRGIFISSKCQDSFGSLLAIGISSMIGLQAFINLGAISGILPITGVPLPFVSYGGSSLLVLMISMGIMNNIAMSVKKAERTPVTEHKKTEPHIYQNRGGRTWQK